MKSEREKTLIENYEEAAFALMMDRKMQEDGEMLLQENERLASDPDFVLPGGMDERCLRLIRRNQEKQRYKNAYHKAGKIVSRVAVIFLVIAIAFAIPFCTVSAFRSSVLNLVIETFDKGTTVKAVPEDGQYADPVIGNGPGWIPEGFSLDYTEKSDSMLVIKYTDSDEHKISYDEFPEAAGTAIDTEDADEIEQVTVSGSKAVLAVKKEQIVLLWTDSERNVVCKLSTVGINKDITMEIAKSVK
jgi:hypothetical protein